MSDTGYSRGGGGGSGGGGYGRGGGGGGRGRGGGGWRGRGGGGRGGGGRGGGRGGEGGGEASADDNHDDSAPRAGSTGTHQELDSFLKQIDGANYGRYKNLRSHYRWTEGLPIELFVDHVQGDPYAAPSRFRARLPMSATGIPMEVYGNSARVIAFTDYVNRQIVSLVKQWRLDIAGSSGGYHGPKGGDFDIYKPRQQILERSSCVLLGLDAEAEGDGGYPCLEIRFSVTLPAHGRSINGTKVHELLITHLPQIIDKGFLWSNQDEQKVWKHLRTAELQDALRNSLAEKGLLAFVGNGSVLPRASGAAPGPMTEGVVEFQSPKSLEVTIDTSILSEDGTPISVTGMGIPRGIVVITGGGFHGKSTLLEAIQFGIYNVIPGDGRELVVIEHNAYKVRAEDGRNVVCTDITPFISELPGGKSTSSFSSQDASGSTSMAANIQEALEVGATTLIIDEDTSATNFLIRDHKMHELVRSEPITPLVSKVSALFTEHAVSTVIVVGGCGDYLSPATTVIGMESYLPQDWTSRARAISEKYPNAAPTAPTYGAIPCRTLTIPSGALGDRQPIPKGVDKIVIRAGRNDDDAELDTSALEQFVEEGQTTLAVHALQSIQRNSAGLTAQAWANMFAERRVNISRDPMPRGNIAAARPLELLAVVNRLRGLQVRKVS
ncbi:hypothetical protein BZA05DRAFT_339694 [Tricharina praecox]|uniref:uncharacterized protein n=1 Tax=Tricharina praecox TaxID=43433 RepID=UPI00222071A5|nr:uncharacterized protein BZA05DRAFT_339694 [Tricharina praecox]KAI5848892.1 hypothetical protein BZA05DRAFT_339694 [Tricharina praecox]